MLHLNYYHTLEQLKVLINVYANDCTKGTPMLSEKIKASNEILHIPSFSNLKY